ncbi:MAG: hypothetical protein ACRD2E_10260 [Terriglobales bacterium]
MRKSTNDFAKGDPGTAVYFALMTTLALAVEAFLVVLFMRAPVIRGGPAITYYPALVICLLPWLSGCAYWARASRRAAPGDADRGAPRTYYQAVFTIVAAAYLAVLSVSLLLLQVSVSAR